VFLLCFSLNCYHSFSNIEKLWLPEAREVCPDSKFILVGTKLDLVDTGENCACQGKQKRKNLGTTSSGPGNAAKMGKMTMTRTMRRMTSRMLDRMRLHAEEWTEEEEEEEDRKPTKSDVLNLLKKADGIIESYLECSAKTEKNVHDVFQDAVRVVLSNDKKLKRRRNHHQIVDGKMLGLEHFAERHHCALL
jgi:GTPase SAR1 family protein